IQCNRHAALVHRFEESVTQFVVYRVKDTDDLLRKIGVSGFKRFRLRSLVFIRVHQRLSAAALRNISANSMSAGVVILKFLAEPITTATSCPARSTKGSSSARTKLSRNDASKASRITAYRKPCGVCTRPTRSRGLDEVTRAPSRVRSTWSSA